MGVRFFCPNGHKLHVKSFLAGKRGICPHCDMRFTIPHESTGRVAAVASSRRSDAHATPSGVAQMASPSVAGPVMPAVLADFPNVGAAAAPDSASPKMQWYVRPATGGQFGPADSQVLHEWIEQGRVPDDARVWREGWEDWRIASEVIEELAPRASEQPSPSNPFDNEFPELDDSLNDDSFRSSAALRVGKRHSAVNNFVFGLVALVVVLAVALGIIIALR